MVGLERFAADLGDDIWLDEGNADLPILIDELGTAAGDVWICVESIWGWSWLCIRDMKDNTDIPLFFW
jgi:hypothetical protein